MIIFREFVISPSQFFWCIKLRIWAITVIFDLLHPSLLRLPDLHPLPSFPCGKCSLHLSIFSINALSGVYLQVSCPFTASLAMAQYGSLVVGIGLVIFHCAKSPSTHPLPFVRSQALLGSRHETLWHSAFIYCIIITNVQSIYRGHKWVGKTFQNILHVHHRINEGDTSNIKYYSFLIRPKFIIELPFDFGLSFIKGMLTKMEEASK